MAKDKYMVSTITEISGLLDYDQNEELVVFIENRTPDGVITTALPIIGVLNHCVGEKIALKLIDEKDMVE